MKRYTYYIIMLLALLASCGDSEYEYSNYPCYLIIDNSVHQDQTLAASLNPMSPGVFCRIYEQPKDGAETFFFANNQGASSTKRLNAVDLKRSRLIGTYNGSGIIIGYGALDKAFYAFDAQCPNCYKEANLPRYVLTMDTSGKAHCNTCKREYDLNNGGIVSAGTGGDKLIRYHAANTGALGTLSVTNGGH